MKRGGLAILLDAPKIGWRDLWLTLVPALLWLGAIYGRGVMISPRCGLHPESCTPQSVPAIDRLTLGQESGDADGYSFMTQNAAGVISLSAPVLWQGFLAASSALSPSVALANAGTDLVIIVQTAAWNGLATEISHWTGRPRPFVYQDPARRGRDPAHHTSFYSGHTSFVAAVMTALFIVLLSRGAPLPILFLAAASGEALVFSTGVFRMLAGRHFLTDVIAATIAGSLVATCVAYLHRKRPAR